MQAVTDVRIAEEIREPKRGRPRSKDRVPLVAIERHLIEEQEDRDGDVNLID